MCKHEQLKGEVTVAETGEACYEVEIKVVCVFCGAPLKFSLYTTETTKDKTVLHVDACIEPATPSNNQN